MTLNISGNVATYKRDTYVCLRQPVGMPALFVTLLCPEIPELHKQPAYFWNDTLLILCEVPDESQDVWQVRFSHYR